MTTFTLANTFTSGYVDPATEGMTGVTEGNLLLCVLAVRTGTGSTAHTVTDTKSDPWTPIIRHDQELSDPNARQSFSVWWRTVSAADTTTTTTVTGDDGTADNKSLMIFEFSSSAAYDWTFGTKSSGDTGAGSTSPVSTGTASAPGAADAFVFACATWRYGTAAPTAIAFTNVNSAVSSLGGASSNRIEIAGAFYTSGQADGTQSSSVSWSGTGHEAAAGILTFTDGAVGSTVTITDTIFKHYYAHLLGGTS